MSVEINTKLTFLVNCFIHVISGHKRSYYENNLLVSMKMIEDLGSDLMNGMEISWRLSIESIPSSRKSTIDELQPNKKQNQILVASNSLSLKVASNLDPKTW